jgi:intracellular septation protein A
MHFLADYFPLLLFFVAFKLWGIYTATAVAIVPRSCRSPIFVLRGRVAPVRRLNLAIIAVFGGATLLLHDETFIKWKPTVLYWLFALILAAGRLVFGATSSQRCWQALRCPSRSGADYLGVGGLPGSDGALSVADFDRRMVN